MRAFLRHALDPADRLGEILFGLIMALGFTGAVRLGREEADNHALFVASGPTIRDGVRLPVIRSRDVAPTVAATLGLPFEGIEGAIVSAALR